MNIQSFVLLIYVVAAYGLYNVIYEWYKNKKQ